MNWFITVLCLIALGQGALCNDCKDLEPGHYPVADKCDHYHVCTGAKGSGVIGASPIACPPGTKFDKYQRQCIPGDKVDCNWCKSEAEVEEDPTSKNHFIACWGPKGMLHAQRYKCNTGEYDPKEKKCGGSAKPLDYNTDATPDHPTDRKVHAEEAGKVTKPSARCPVCTCHMCG